VEVGRKYIAFARFTERRDTAEGVHDTEGGKEGAEAGGGVETISKGTEAEDRRDAERI
jgi:hypothetical protein